MSNGKKTGYKIVAVGMAAVLTITTAGVLYAKETGRIEKEKPKTESVTAETGEEKKETSLSLLNTEQTIGKEETVYILADVDGSPDKVIVSNWLKNPEKKDILEDRSDLTDIVNVKGEEGYRVNPDGMQVWEAKGADIYYQGTTDKTLPVEVNISYQLDGKPVTAKELAGKSGKVTMRFDYTNKQKESIKVNGKAEELYVPFLMVSGIILDNEKFSNIQVSSGKLVNDGNRSIVVGYALPGLQENLNLDAEKLEIPNYVEITADVKDFELMTTLTIATNEMFSKVNLDNVSTLEELEEALNTLSDSSKQLVDGSATLQEGTATLLSKSKELVDGVDKLFAGADQLKSGAAQLDAGAATLKAGIAILQAGVWKLDDGAKKLDDGAKELDKGAADLNAGASDLKGGIGELDAGAQQLAQGAPALSEGIQQIQNGLGVLVAQNDTLNGGAAQVFNSLLSSANSQLAAAGLTLPAALTMENYETVLTQVITALEGNPAQASVQGVLEQLKSYQAFYDGLGAYTGGVAAAYNGMVDNKMAEGAATLAEGSAKLAAGSHSLLAGSGKLLAGTGRLKEGTAGLTAGTAELLNGTAQLAVGTEQLVKGADDLSAGTGAVSAGADELQAGIGTLKTGSGALIDGVSQLNDGAVQLAAGMKKFDEEGIQKLADAYNGDIKGLIERMKATVEASKHYQTFSGKADDVEGSVQFIFRTEGVEAE